MKKRRNLFSAMGGPTKDGGADLMPQKGSPAPFPPKPKGKKKTSKMPKGLR